MRSLARKTQLYAVLVIHFWFMIWFWLMFNITQKRERLGRFHLFSCFNRSARAFLFRAHLSLLCITRQSSHRADLGAALVNISPQSGHLASVRPFMSQPEYV